MSDFSQNSPQLNVYFLCLWQCWNPVGAYASLQQLFVRCNFLEYRFESMLALSISSKKYSQDVSRLKDRRFRFILLISFLLWSLILYLLPTRIIPDVTSLEITNSCCFLKRKKLQLSIVREIIHKPANSRFELWWNFGILSS